MTQHPPVAGGPVPLGRPSPGRNAGARECEYLAWLDPLSGVLEPYRCRTLICTQCGAHSARERAYVASWAQQRMDWTRLVTLTRLPTTGDALDWDRTRHQIRDLTRRIRASGIAWEWAWAVEANPQGTGFHLHGVQHGTYIDQRFLEKLWGGRRVDIRAVQRQRGAQYLTKEVATVCGYTTKSAGDGGLEHHLALNGGRPLHWSRRFLHGHRYRDALRLMHEERPNPPEETRCLIDLRTLSATTATTLTTTT